MMSESSFPRTTSRLHLLSPGSRGSFLPADWSWSLVQIDLNDPPLHSTMYQVAMRRQTSLKGKHQPIHLHDGPSDAKDSLSIRQPSVGNVLIHHVEPSMTRSEHSSHPAKKDRVSGGGGARDRERANFWLRSSGGRIVCANVSSRFRD